MYGYFHLLPVHVPLQHWFLLLHVAPVPRLHCPGYAVPAPQQKLLLPVQLVQVAPPVPQALFWLPLRQVLPSQQPFGQVAAEHIMLTQLWFRHSWPAGQLTHVTPLVPQAVFWLPGWQVLFWQQPLGQLVGLHTQLPLEHAVPAGQATQVTPPVPHAWFVLPA